MKNLSKLIHLIIVKMHDKIYRAFFYKRTVTEMCLRVSERDGRKRIRRRRRTISYSYSATLTALIHVICAGLFDQFAVQILCTKRLFWCCSPASQCRRQKKRTRRGKKYVLERPRVKPNKHISNL